MSLHLCASQNLTIERIQLLKATVLSIICKLHLYTPQNQITEGFSDDPVDHL